MLCVFLFVNILQLCEENKILFAELNTVIFSELLLSLSYKFS